MPLNYLPLYNHNLNLNSANSVQLISEVLMLIHRTRVIQNLLITKLLKIPHSVTMSFNDNRRWVNHYAGLETPVSTICEQFSKFEGGKIELSKDDESGVAILKINHPERRNALSGIMNS
jgi:hypothetical protein